MKLLKVYIKHILFYKRRDNINISSEHFHELLVTLGKTLSLALIALKMIQLSHR